MTRLHDDDRVRLASDSVWSKLGEDVVILDLNSDSYLGLEKVGAAVWSMLGRPRRVADLESEIATLYEVDTAVLGGDLRHFLEDLVDRGLVVVVDEEARPA